MSIIFRSVLHMIYIDDMIMYCRYIYRCTLEMREL